MTTENTTKPFRFYRFPFVLLATLLSIGVLIGYEVDFNLMSVFLSFGVLFISMFLFFRSTKAGFWVFLLFVFNVFIGIGVMNVQPKKIPLDQTQILANESEIHPIIIEITEVGPSEKEWKKVIGKVVQSTSKELNHDHPVVLYIQMENFELTKGDVVLAKTELFEIQNSGNPGEFDSKNYWNKKGISSMGFIGSEAFQVVDHIPAGWITNTLLNFRTSLKNILEENLSGKELSIALALILGDKSLLDVETTASFTNTGAMHVLAVSGLHVGIIMQILMVFFGYFSKWIKRKWALWFIVGLMWVYAIITGLSPSVLRAVFMFSVLVIAQNSGRNYNNINVLFFTGFCLILVDPFTLYDIGFQLSFLAMLGIFLFYRSIEKIFFIKNKVILKIWQGTAIGFAAQIMTTPLSLYYFHQFPNYFILTNIGLMASSGLILGLGLFIFAIGWFKWLANITGLALGLIVLLSLRIIEAVENIPGAVAFGFSVDIVLVFIIGLLALGLFLVFKNKNTKIVGLTLFIGLLGLIVYRRNENLNKNEICVFNAKNLVVSIKHKNQLICIHNSRNEKELKKTKFLIESYTKQFPAHIKWISCLKNDFAINNSKLNFQLRKSIDGFELYFNNELYRIYTKEPLGMSNKNSIAMPWVHSGAMVYLENGPFRLEF